MKKILFIINYLILDDEGGNSRFLYLAKKLAEDNNFEVEIATSSFLHVSKKFREGSEKTILVGSNNVKVTFLSELGYMKNISIKRILSNKSFSKSVRQYLNNRINEGDSPDLIYFSVPSLEYGEVITDFSKKHNIPTIADIQDIWPEAFEMVSPLPNFLNKLFFYNSRKLSKRIYKNANRTIAVSNTYGKIVDSFRVSSIKTNVVYLGSDFGDFDNYFKKKKHTDGITRFTYVGTLGNSYDLNGVIEAFHLLQDSQYQRKFEFHIFGTGPLKDSLKEKTRNYGLLDYIFFHGILPYNKMVERLGEMDVAINPIRNGAAQSIINKVGDYAAAGLPVLNTQENREYRDLVSKRKIGINTTNHPEDIRDSLIELCNLQDLEIMGKNNRLLGEELFDRRRTYGQIINLIEEAVENK